MPNGCGHSFPSADLKSTQAAQLTGASILCKQLLKLILKKKTPFAGLKLNDIDRGYLKRA